MDLLYPRICQVAYGGGGDSAGGDVNYGNYDTYNYYNDLEFIENEDYLDLEENEDEDIELVWRYSSKKPAQQPPAAVVPAAIEDNGKHKRPRFKKSYTTLESYNNVLSSNQRNDAHKYTSGFIKPRAQNTLRNSPTSSASSQRAHYIVQQDDENNILNLSSVNRNSKLNSRNELIRSKYRLQSAFPSAVEMQKTKNDYYLEYINLINNPSMQPRYLTEAIKYQASEKKICEKFAKSIATNRLLQDIHSHRQQIKNADYNAQNVRKPKRNELLQRENNEKIKPFDSASFEPSAKSRITKKERERIPKLSSLQTPVPQRPQVIIRPKVPDDALRDGNERGSGLNRYPVLPKTNTFSTIDSVDLESEERDLFYTDVDVISRDRRGRRSSQSNNNSRLAERSPDIYTEIVKIPTHFDDMSDDEYHKLEIDLGVKELEEQGSLGGSDDFDNDSDEKPSKEIDDLLLREAESNDMDGRPAAAGRERKRIVSFDTHVVSNDDEFEEMFANENEVSHIAREIVKRKKLSRDASEELEEQLEDASAVVDEQAQVGEIKVEKSKTPEPAESEEEDEKYEIKLLPEFNINKEPSVTILKPTTKSVIRLAPTVEKKPEPARRAKRDKIDINSLRPKFLKRVQFYEDGEEEVAEEEVFVYTGDDWLTKWCIFKEGQCNKFERIFDEYDYMDKDYINGENLVMALERSLPLSNIKMTYLMRIMGLLDVDPFKYGTNKRTFCVIAALGQRIQHLDDEWFKNLLPRLDVKSVENKVFKVKQLWDFLVDKDMKKVRIDDLMIEMRAGNVTDEHVKYAQEKFAEKISFDLLDYLTYVPLFIHIHQKIVIDPFDKKDQI